MLNNSKRFIPILIIILAAVAYGTYYTYQVSQQAKGLVVSGTIEATEVHLGALMGGLVNQVFAHEGDNVSQGQVLAEVQPASGVTSGYTEKVRTPIDGVILTRAFEPGEITAAGSTMLVVGDLSVMTLTVYVPEDSYGQIDLGQEYPVTVDSFPDEVFTGRVTHIANQAEFTPRNVQTVQGRKNTVYAIRLTIDNPTLALKPGMPADVRLEIE
jgi:multidrug efflux pump subunit AcrA (membrane-fusion protein)